MNDEAPLPGVIVLGVDSAIGLAVIRDLGRHGVPVHAIGSHPTSIGLQSRYVRSRHQRCAEPFHTWLPALAAVCGVSLVMAISESDIQMLNRERSLMPALKLLIPSAETMAIVLDKQQTLMRAAQLGITVPQNWLVHHSADVHAVADAIDFPVVLKWSDPQAVIAHLESAGLTLQKAEFATTLGALESALQRYDPIGQYPLIQGYAAGYGIGHMIFMVAGEPILQFQHQRIHEWPPEGGTSTVCRAVPLDEFTDLRRKSVQLLQSIGWEGAAMVEYRYDPLTGKAVLMEINGRFWGSLPLAIHAGASFPWLAYVWQGLGKTPTVPSPERHMEARYMFAETRRLMRVILQPSRIRDPFYKNTPWRDLAHYLFGFIKSGSRYYVWSWGDPKPFFSDVIQAAQKALGVLRGL